LLYTKLFHTYVITFKRFTFPESDNSHFFQTIQQPHSLTGFNQKMKSKDTLFNLGFLTLNALVLFSFSNLAVFFSFYSYLKTLPIPGYWHGILIGLLSASALIVRPLISTRLTPRNAIRGVALGLAFMAVSLLLYSHAHSLLFMALLRILHGAAYVTMVSSTVTLLMVFMPPEKSGQGFGIITIMTLLPYAIIPFVIENSFAHVPLDSIYCFMALLMLPPGLLLIPLAKRVREHALSEKQSADKLPKGSLWLNVSQPKILCLLVANGLLFAVFALVFFFLKTFCANSGIGNPGLFFTTSTGVMIAIRIFLGPLFDRFNKAALTIISLIMLAISLTLLDSVDSIARFYAAATMYGVGVGAATPLMNGLMFAISRPLYRGLNTNLMMEMVDAGFFLGPAICGFALATGFSQTTIISVCIGAIVLAAGLIIPLMKPQTEDEQS